MCLLSSTARIAAPTVCTRATSRPSTRTSLSNVIISIVLICFNTVAKAVSESTGQSLQVYFNQVPKAWAMEDSYCQLIPCNDPESDVYSMIPRIGAFEVTYKGVLMYSKLLSQMWPHVPTVAFQFSEMLKESHNGASVAKLRQLF